jgi:hypothetical protein
MEPRLPPFTDVLGRLPWYPQLTEEHHADMLVEFSNQLLMNMSRDEFMGRWDEVERAGQRTLSLADG